MGTSLANPHQGQHDAYHAADKEDGGSQQGPISACLHAAMIPPILRSSKGYYVKSVRDWSSTFRKAGVRMYLRDSTPA